MALGSVRAGHGSPHRAPYPHHFPRRSSPAVTPAALATSRHRDGLPPSLARDETGATVACRNRPERARRNGALRGGGLRNIFPPVFAPCRQAQGVGNGDGVLAIRGSTSRQDRRRATSAIWYHLCPFTERGEEKPLPAGRLRRGGVEAFPAEDGAFVLPGGRFSPSDARLVHVGRVGSLSFVTPRREE
jgi:hypothetical protein